MKIRMIVTAVSLTIPMLAAAEATSPWLPIPGELTLTGGYSHQSGKSAFIGDKEVAVWDITGGAASKFERSSKSLILSYGINDMLALDAAIGYGEVKAGKADEDSGMADSTIGLSWRVADEYTKTHLPTITLHGGYIIAGSYKAERLAALGNGENGLDVSVLIGKQLTDYFSLAAELGSQKRSGKIPIATYYDLTAGFTFSHNWGATIGYSNKQYGGNLDIGGPGFSPARFQEVRDERTAVKASLSYAIAGNQNIALHYASLIKGRNTVNDDNLLGLSYTIGF